MADILNIIDEPIFDDRIVKIDTHTYNPYANTTFGHSDKIRISSSICCRAKVFSTSKEDWQWRKKTSSTTFGNNWMASVFDEIRYKLNSMIDRNRNIGIMLNY